MARRRFAKPWLSERMRRFDSYLFRSYLGDYLERRKFMANFNRTVQELLDDLEDRNSNLATTYSECLYASFIAWQRTRSRRAKKLLEHEIEITRDYLGY